MLNDAFKTLLDSVDHSTSELLEESYRDSLIWISGELEKARVVAPVGTIRRVGETEYIKTAQGWRYKAKNAPKKREDLPEAKQPKGEEQQGSDKNQQSQSTIQVGHEITAPDGTKGKVTENDGQMATVEYIKDGEKKTAQVPSNTLEQRKQNGEIQHNSKPTTLQDHHKKMAEDMAIEGKSSSTIVSHLKGAGVDEDEAMKHVVDIKSKRGGKGPDETSKESAKDKGFDESKGDEDVTGKSEKLPKQDDEIDEDHEDSVKYQADNEKSHQEFVESKKNNNVVDSSGAEIKKDPELDTKQVTKEEDKLDPETVQVNKKFGAFARQVRSVINGSMKGSLVYGTGGVGKTYTITKELEKAGKRQFVQGIHEPGDDDYDYVKITGRVTPVAMYKLMHQHKDKIMVFDDCNSVLEDKNSLDMLKGALDTSGDGTITWGSGNPPKDDDGKPLDQTLKFTGKVIFATNLPIKELTKKDKDLAAVLTRGPGMDLSMTPKETLTRIKSIAADPKTGKLTNLKFPGTPNYSEKDMKDILGYLDKNKDNKDLDISVRTIGTLLGLKKEADKDGVNWEDDADYAVLKKSEDNISLTPFQQKQKRINASFGKGHNPDLLKSKVEFYKSMSTGTIVSREHVEGILYDEDSKPFKEDKHRKYSNNEKKIEKAFNILIN